MWAWMYGCTTKSIFWICGCTARWMLGCMVAPQNKSLDVRLHHKMDAWMHGCTTVNTDPYQKMSGPNETKIKWGALLFAPQYQFFASSFVNLAKLVCQFHGNKRLLEPGWWKTLTLIMATHVRQSGRPLYYIKISGACNAVILLRPIVVLKSTQDRWATLHDHLLYVSHKIVRL